MSLPIQPLPQIEGCAEFGTGYERFVHYLQSSGVKLLILV